MALEIFGAPGGVVDGSVPVPGTAGATVLKTTDFDVTPADNGKTFVAGGASWPRVANLVGDFQPWFRVWFVTWQVMEIIAPDGGFWAWPGGDEDTSAKKLQTSASVSWFGFLFVKDPSFVGYDNLWTFNVWDPAWFTFVAK